MAQPQATQAADDRRAPPVRVMYLTVGPAISQLYGAELSLLQLLDRLDTLRFQVCSVIVQDEGAMSEAVRARRLPVGLAGIRPFDKTHPLSLIPFAASFRQALAAAREARPDLIHVNHLILNQYGGLLARRLGIPSICHLRGRPTRRSYWGQLACLSTAIITNSHFTAGSWIRIPSARRRIHVIHNGIAVEDFSREVQRHRNARSREYKDRVVLGVIGRIDPDKGHDVFLRALQGVAQTMPRALALIAGDAAPEQQGYERQMRRLADGLGLAGNVNFVGPLADPRPFYAQLDALVLPSRYEPFGRVLIEAMAAGLPVIATESGGPSEIVKHGKTGLLVPPGDAEALAEAIRTIASSPDLRKEFGRTGFERAVSHFSLDRHTTAIQGLYRELAESRRRTCARAHRPLARTQIGWRSGHGL